MKCSVPRCANELIGGYKPDLDKLTPPQLDLCKEHQRRYEADYRKHYGPLVNGLARKWLVNRKTAQERVDATLDALTDALHQNSWQATWLQMVDLELLNSGNGLGVQKGHMSKEGVWVPDGQPAAPRPSYPGYAKMKGAPLPEHATRAGQAAIARRAEEQAALERQLAADKAEFERGQRQVLELELKTKRALARAKKT